MTKRREVGVATAALAVVLSLGLLAGVLTDQGRRPPRVAGVTVADAGGQ